MDLVKNWSDGMMDGVTDKIIDWIQKIIKILLNNPKIRDGLDILAKYIIDPDKQPWIIKMMFSEQNIIKSAKLVSNVIGVLAGTGCTIAAAAATAAATAATAGAAGGSAPMVAAGTGAFAAGCAKTSQNLFMKFVKYLMTNQVVRKQAIYISQMYLASKNPEDFVHNLLSCPDITKLISSVKMIFTTKLITVDRLNILFHKIVKCPVIGKNIGLLKKILDVIPRDLTRNYPQKLLDELPPNVSDLILRGIKTKDFTQYSEYIEGKDIGDEDDVHDAIINEEDLILDASHDDILNEYNHDNTGEYPNNEYHHEITGEYPNNEYHHEITREYPNNKYHHEITREYTNNEYPTEYDTEQRNPYSKKVKTVDNKAVIALNLKYPKTLEDIKILKRKIISDLATSLGMNPSMINILNLEPGSVIITFEINSNNPKYIKTLKKNLYKQVEDKTSKLYQGIVTKSVMKKSEMPEDTRIKVDAEINKENTFW